MKKYWWVLLLIVFLFTGCVNQSDYDTLNESYLSEVKKSGEFSAENDQLKSEILAQKSQIEQITAENTELSSKIEIMEKEYSAISAELDELKNGAENRMIKIRNLFEDEKYSEVVKAADELHEKFNGTEQDMQAQELSAKSTKIIEQIEAEKRAEEERAAAEALKSEQEKAREIIRVTKVAVSKPDSAGGVELYFNYVNNSEKTIKYVTFGVTFYNAVGDVVTCQYKRDTINRCKDTGPFEKGQGRSGTWWHWGDFYNWDIKSVKLVSLSIEYTDGTTRSLTDKEIEYVQY